MANPQIAHDALMQLITPEAFSWNVGQTNGGNDDRQRRVAREMVRVAWVLAEEWERRVNEGQDTE